MFIHTFILFFLALTFGIKLHFDENGFGTNVVAAATTAAMIKYTNTCI